ncbi:MAG: hypothetical protein HOB40_05895 [Candidatus Marinimicrobia bacterium]|jgi:hypothetical protein|nr:hypothetical protein [Candidatus Neomarinimicrobiota bacterium]MBT3840226.1 hypothetical protein [Candidatus Neomarinimicrobiota bacterium]MBT4000384.1 hypothetical protein [Candidatus Neomarinimicrobiota bacterium]MBT4283013.1 hypothetical protein [Candidatus Neomarinimicrobiota bacterium]MBT4579874.1 hypothetical protein [Candidatus Neomarinimicrobiota bacterium]
MIQIFKMNYKSSILFSFLFYYSCAPSIPDWVGNQPTDSNYWHGIGIAEKSSYSDPRGKAREFAIHEVTSQIRVNISSEMKIMIKETNQSLDNATSLLMKSRTDLLIPEMEFVSVYKTKDTFYFYARLNKKKYYDAIARMRENATNAALGYVRDADENFGVQSFALIQKAWQEILSFNDEPIQVYYNNKEVHLYSLIKQKMEEYEQRIKLVGILDYPKMKSFVDRENVLNISIIDQFTQAPLDGIPILIQMNSEKFTRTSNRRGEITIDILSNPSSESFSIRFQLDDSELFKDLSHHANLLNIKPKSNSVRVDISPAKVAIEFLEKNMGRQLKTPMITPAIKEYFSGKVEFVNRNPDMIIKIDASTIKKSDRSGKNYPFFTYGDVSVVFMDTRTNKEFFSSQISNIKGGDFGSQQTAGIRAYEKMAKQIIQELNEKLSN